MMHLGDITKISGYDAPTVNVIIGGSPCQDLSISGNREGLKGKRSGLFMEMIRIIREMREKDENAGRAWPDIRPRFMVWENVPGAFTVNGGWDFAAVIEERQKQRKQAFPMFFHLQTGGLLQDVFWETDGALHGEYLTHSFGESPSEDVESHLSQILEADARQKYCLSAKACKGILNRANRRSKGLPMELEQALKAQAGMQPEEF